MAPAAGIRPPTEVHLHTETQPWTGSASHPTGLIEIDIGEYAQGDLGAAITELSEYLWDVWSIDVPLNFTEVSPGVWTADVPADTPKSTTND